MPQTSTQELFVKIRDQELLSSRNQLNHAHFESLTYTGDCRNAP